MNRRCRFDVASAALVALVVSLPLALGPLRAQERPASRTVPEVSAPSARHLAAAVGAVKKRDYTTAAVEYRAAIDLEPTSVAAHTGYILAVQSREYERAGLYTADTTAQRRVAMDAARVSAARELGPAYQGWASRFPTSAAVEWGLGRIHEEEPVLAASHDQKAVALDPRFARAWIDLGRLAQEGDARRQARDDFRRAAEAEPTSDYNAYMWVMATRPVDAGEYRRAADDLARRFPASDWAARALASTAELAETPAARIEILERVRTAFAGTPNGSAATRSVFELQLGLDPLRAADIARSALAASVNESDRTTWQGLAAFARQLADARALLSSSRAEDARRLLADTRPPKSLGTTALALMRAEAADAAGDSAAAYAELLQLVAANQRTRDHEARLVACGRKLGKTAGAIENDIWAARTKNAGAAKDFTLATYAGTKVSLADFRGKVVLLNFWFPT